MATSFTTMRPFWSSPSDAIRSLAGNPGRRCTAFQENAGTTPAPFWSSPSDAIRSLAGNPGRRCTAFQENAGTIPAFQENAGTIPAFQENAGTIPGGDPSGATACSYHGSAGAYAAMIQDPRERYPRRPHVRHRRERERCARPVPSRDLLPRGGANNMRGSANGVGKRRQFVPILSHLSWSSGPW
jgi:hypothetical protein